MSRVSIVFGLLWNLTLKIDEETLHKIALFEILALSFSLIVIFSVYQSKQKMAQEINKKNEYLNQLLTERDWLLKEVNHRVKNNLQIVISMLESQLSYLKDDKAFIAIRESQQRMYSVSLIHQKLYYSDRYQIIDMQSYIVDLVEFCKDSLIPYDQIRFTLDIERVYLDVSQAVSVGLILNECMTNSIKYAFPNPKPYDDCRITIGLQESANNMIHISVSDNGIGLPDNYVPPQKEGLGMKLIEGLVSQLDASIQYFSNRGLTVRFSFKKINVSNAGPGRFETRMYTPMTPVSTCYS